MARSRARCANTSRSRHQLDPPAGDAGADLYRPRRLRHRDRRNRGARMTGRSDTRLHYGWVIVAVSFVLILITAGVRAAPGVLIVPFEDEFHWSRATIS